MMPDMNGFEVLSAVLIPPAAYSVIVISALEQMENT
jgi:CheY-like chemotaxis protein